MSVYSWPISLINKIEGACKNFIWNGNSNQRKMVMIAWKKVCQPKASGGLGIRFLICLNETDNLKLCWEFLNSNEYWATILRSKVLRQNRVICHHISSIIWSGIKVEFQKVIDNSN